MIARGLILVPLLALAGCASGPASLPKEEVRITLGCTEGLVAEAELRKRLTAGSNSQQVVRDYLFEALPENRRFDAYRLYLECTREEKERTAERAGVEPRGYHPRLEKLVGRSGDLWNAYSACAHPACTVPAARSDDYALMAAVFRNLEQSGFDQRDRITKTDQEATLYFIASEILIRSADPSPDLRTRAVGYSRLARDAASLSRAQYEGMLASGGNPGELKWARDNGLAATTWHRLAAAQAQLFFATGQPSMLLGVQELLQKLPCDYIRDNRLAADAAFTRIPQVPRLRECG